jgi:hypothetical protein
MHRPQQGHACRAEQQDKRDKPTLGSPTWLIAMKMS